MTRDDAQNLGVPTWLTLAAALLVAAACCLSLAPFLPILEFSNGGENAVVASVQEIHRGGPWLVPTLHEEQRTKKPPLATWLSALAARPQTMALLSNPSPAVRHEAFADFAWQVRWPALAAMGGVIVATCVLGMLLGGPRLGLVAAIVCGSSFLWLRNARLATTDAHLALWVGVANCLFAVAVLERRRWLGYIGGGVALGLAMMSKGPVALLQTLVPLLAFVAWHRWRGQADFREGEPPGEPRLGRSLALPTIVSAGAKAVLSRTQTLLPPLVGFALFALVGLSWYFLVWWQNPAVWAQWKTELTRQGATGLQPSKWYNYILLFPIIFPWSLFLIVGLIDTTRAAFTRHRADDPQRSRMVLATFLLIVPIVVMSFFRDREIRYLIPLLPPASILAAWGLLALLANATRGSGSALVVAAFHWLPLLAVAIALPLAAPLGFLRTIDDQPWYSLRLAIIAAEVLGLLIVAAMILQRRSPVWAVAIGTAVVMLGWNVLLNAGYRNHREGRSEMRPLAEQILASVPEAKVYSFRPDNPVRHAPIDLSIYLNRVVANVADSAELAGTSGRRVYVVRRKNVVPLSDPSELEPRAGGPWRFFAATPVDDSIWYAFTSVQTGDPQRPL